MKMDNKTYLLSETGSFGNKALFIGIAGLILSAIGFFIDTQQFFFSYLNALVFWLTIALGALFLTMLHHLAAAKWSVVIRRLSEGATAVFILLGILFIPILLGLKNLYEWSHADIVAGDPLMQSKSFYLSNGFFAARTVIYFIAWYLIAHTLYRISIRQDMGYQGADVRKMRVLSAEGMVLLGITLSFASFDWLMSLDANWYSTIFGVYVYAGSVVGALAFITLVALYLRKKKILHEVITVEHYHDLGKMLFAFVIFWAYIAFSQYLLIWYGNIPEETVWFRDRWTGSWKVISLIIVFGHFGIPFFILITRGAKRHMWSLGALAFWLLIMHWIDLYWIILPSLHQQGAHFSWLDFTATVGVGGLFLWLVWRRFTAGALVPVNDPNLEASMNFENV